MIKLFLRNYILFVIIILLVGGAGWWFSSATEQYQENENGQLVLRYVFSQVQQALVGKPKTDWNAIVQGMRPKYGNPMSVIPYSQVPEKAKAQKSLLKGRIVASYYDPSNGTAGALDKAIGVDTSMDFVFQRIQNSNWYIRYQLYGSHIPWDKAQSAWVGEMLLVQLNQAPRSHWPSVIQRLRNETSWKMSLIPYDSLKPKVKRSFDHYHFAYTGRYFDDIETFWFPTRDPKTVLQLGPLEDNFFVRNSMFFVLAVGFIALFILIWFWTFPFYRALRRLLKMAEAFGEGDFAYETKVSKRLALYPLYENLSKMGKRIGRLIQSHKELTGAVSHEIRTPLARMRFATEMLEKGDEEGRQKYIDHINADIVELDELVDELLTYSRFDRENTEIETLSVDVSDFVKPLFDQFAERFTDKAWTLSCDLHSKIQVDPKLFHKALSNLLSNAYRYGESQIRLTVSESVSGLQFIVEDDGPGIPLDKREAVFEPFMRLDESRQRGTGGHGLGLSVVKKVIEAHGGSVSIGESEMGGAAVELLISSSSKL